MRCWLVQLFAGTGLEGTAGQWAGTSRATHTRALKHKLGPIESVNSRGPRLYHVDSIWNRKEERGQVHFVSASCPAVVSGPSGDSRDQGVCVCVTRGLTQMTPLLRARAWGSRVGHPLNDRKGQSFDQSRPQGSSTRTQTRVHTDCEPLTPPGPSLSVWGQSFSNGPFGSVSSSGDPVTGSLCLMISLPIRCSNWITARNRQLADIRGLNPALHLLNTEKSFRKLFKIAWKVSRLVVRFCDSIKQITKIRIRFEKKLPICINTFGHSIQVVHKL